ncbi:MAG: hypothetical protein QW607_12465 [Desulfurococcaceae archaeon]
MEKQEIRLGKTFYVALMIIAVSLLIIAMCQIIYVVSIVRIVGGMMGPLTWLIQTRFITFLISI